MPCCGGMEYHIADLKGEPTQHAMEMLDFVLGPRASGRYISELAIDFQVYIPSKEAVLKESRRLLNSNIDRLLENQKDVERQNWKDTHLGDTPRKEKDPTERRQVDANKERLKKAMVKTAPIIQSLAPKCGGSLNGSGKITVQSAGDLCGGGGGASLC